MPKPNRLIADATVLFSGLVFNGLERQVLEKTDIELISIDFNKFEVKRALIEKAFLEPHDAESGVQNLPITFLPLYVYQNQLLEADTLIGYRDKKDVPAVALALSVASDGIWTSDKHFDQITQFKVWTSRKLLENWKNEKA